MNEKRNFDYKRLHPFKWYILENFPFLEDSIDVLTNYQLFCKLGEMYNKEVDAINTLGVQVEGITDWFDDLDVQEEVNNKLDEMAESGQLEEIISAYLNSSAIFGFDNVSDMISAENLINGSYAKTLGYYEPNDGGSATYKIRTITNDDVVDNMFIIEMSTDNSLVAELIYDDIVNVKQLGAKGNGVDDDTSIFQGAIDFNYSNDGKFEISIPEGNYIIDDLNIRKNSKIKGSGWGNTFIKAKANSTNNILKIVESDAYFIKISDFTIIGDKEHSQNPNGIYIKRDTITHDPIEEPKHAGDLWFTMENIRITGVYGNGIGTGSSGSNFRESRLNNIDVNNCGGYGLKLSGSDNNYFQITAWGNVLDGFKISGSAERYISCKAFANGDSEHDSSGFDIVGSGYQITECEAQENFGHGFNLRGTPNSNYIIRTDANGVMQKGSGTYTYGGVNFVENTTNQRINMIVQCYDFYGASDISNVAQGYGLILNDLQQCNITCTSYGQGVANYIINKAYITNPSANNNISVNGYVITSLDTTNIAVQNTSGDAKIFFGGDSNTMGNQYQFFRSNSGLLKIDARYNNSYKSTPFYLNWDNNNNRCDLKLLFSNTDRLGFFGSNGNVKQTVSSVATDASSAITLVNSIRTALINYGLIS